MASKDIVRSAFGTSAGAGSVDASTVKTILVHIQNSGSAKQRLETALSIARATSAHVTCLQVTPIQAYVAFDNFGGVFVMNDVMKAIDAEAVRLRDEVEHELRTEDVNWDYVQLTGDVTSEITSHAALADLVVTGREPRRDGLGIPAVSFLGDLLQRSRTPLVIPGAAPIDPAGPALVAWNGSFEAANAVRASLGLLKLASNVRVLHVTDERQPSDSFPGTRLVEYLSRQGIHAEMTVESLPGADDDVVAAGMIADARRMGGAYIVMGGYGRSRIREYVFGGVTRTLLTESSAPLVIAH